MLPNSASLRFVGGNNDGGPLDPAGSNQTAAIVVKGNPYVTLNPERTLREASARARPLPTDS